MIELKIIKWKKNYLKQRVFEILKPRSLNVHLKEFFTNTFSERKIFLFEDNEINSNNISLKIITKFSDKYEELEILGEVI